MALTYTPEEIMQVRVLIGDATMPYAVEDEIIDAWLVATDGNVRKAASNYWYSKATSFAEMVDITEAGSSRKNSDLFKNAMQLAKQYDDDDGEDNTPVVAASTTRPITRR